MLSLLYLQKNLRLLNEKIKILLKHGVDKSVTNCEHQARNLGLSI